MNSTDYRKVGFARGLRWLPAAAELLFSAFGTLSGVAALWLVVSMIAIIPFVGQLVIMLITPLLTAGAIAAFAQTANGRPPSPGTLFSAFGDPALRRRLLLVGAFGVGGSLLAVTVVASWLGNQVTPEQLSAAQQSPQAMAEMLETVTFGPLLVVAAAIVTVVLAAMYFAIPLLNYRDIAVSTALMASLRAVVANWAAFLGFGLITIAVLGALGLIFGLLALTLGLALGPAGPIIVQVMFLFLAMLVQILMAGTQWVAFADVFGRPPGGRDDSRDDQLLA